MIDDLEDDDCEDMEIVHLTHDELVAALTELNRLRSAALKAMADDR